MNEYIILSLVSILVAGIAAQWLAWRLHISSVLLFLFFGILLGPMTGVIQPDILLGDLLLPLVSLSVALILFEGGLDLNIRELKTIGRTVNFLISAGALVTWLVTSAAAYYILGLAGNISLLLGAVLVVTGPTVIIPLLRQVRPVGRVGSILRWEGILIDPIGALLALLVFQAAFAVDLDTSMVQAALNFFQSLLTGTSIGLLGAYLLVIILHNHLVPDHLQNPITLMVLMVVFSFSNVLQTESGLLAATIMGISLANQRKVDVKKIKEFKETLGLLVLSGLFIVLTARLQVNDFYGLGWNEIFFLLILIFITRPLAVFFSTLGAGLIWQERLFLSFIAPRGVVAVAVSSLFALRLSEDYLIQANSLVPITFMVVIGTVLFYSILALPLARYLDLAQPNPQGILILGAHKWARMIAVVLNDEGYQVTMVDTNPADVKYAQACGINAYQSNILSSDLEERIDINSMGRFLALTSNDEINSLAILSFSDLIGKANVFQLPLRTQEEVPLYLRGRLLFNQHANFDYLENIFDEGAIIRIIVLSQDTDFEYFNEKHGNEIIPMFAQDENLKLSIITEDNQPSLKAGARVFIVSLKDSTIDQLTI